MKKKTAPKKQPQDATLRNARASKSRDAALEARIVALEARATAVEARLAKMEPIAPVP